MRGPATSALKSYLEPHHVSLTFANFHESYLPKMKRRAAEAGLTDDISSKRDKKAPTQDEIENRFSTNLFAPATLQGFKDAYASSAPYPHAVIPSLVDHELLRAVRDEVKEHIHFTPKETDIYRIHQSGDLANLSNLDDASLQHLPNLVQLRNALYSPEFREYLSGITGAGELSGKKADMAVNVYTPGSYLLCHDDVIGSRRVSYILYLTDPDKPWQAEWGGALRLYPTEVKKNQKGEDIHVPLPTHTITIPPAFDQLSFFAVRPGESFHDVEEVYPRAEGEAGDDVDGGRVRMAISGWFHIPQEGEEGYKKGVEEAWAKTSTLGQLEAGTGEFDEPAPFWQPFRITQDQIQLQPSEEGIAAEADDDILSPTEIEFLLRYISPSYLTPDMAIRLSDSFEENSFLNLDKILQPSIADKIEQHVKNADSGLLRTGWEIARPPHKHRFEYVASAEGAQSSLDDPISEIVNVLLPSKTFAKWLTLIIGIKRESLLHHNTLARRFRRGKDYALANTYRGNEPQLEYTLGLTPTDGWEQAQADEHDDTSSETSSVPATNGHSNGLGQFNGSSSFKPADSGPAKVSATTTNGIHLTTPILDVGGQEIYMATDDDADSDRLSTSSKSRQQTGRKVDPAIYRAANEEDDDDDGILFTNAPTWNRLSIVLRDKGTLRFVKYVSRAAKGDRWDVKGEVQLAVDAWPEGEDEADGSQDEEDENEK